MAIVIVMIFARNWMEEGFIDSAGPLKGIWYHLSWYSSHSGMDIWGSILWTCGDHMLFWRAGSEKCCLVSNMTCHSQKSSLRTRFFFFITALKLITEKGLWLNFTELAVRQNTWGRLDRLDRLGLDQVAGERGDTKNFTFSNYMRRHGITSLCKFHDTSVGVGYIPCCLCLTPFVVIPILFTLAIYQCW